MENRRPGAQQGQTPQRRPPVPRYPPPQTQKTVRPRSYPSNPTPYPPPSRGYPPPQVTPPRRTPQASPLRKAPQASQPRKTPPVSQPRKAPPASQLRNTSQASPSRKPAATLRKTPQPEPRFRDVLWPATRETPAENRIALLCVPLYALIHTLCGVLLIYPLNLLTARMPYLLSGIVRALFPGLIGAVLCTLTRFPMRLENRVGLLAYRKLLRAVLTLLVGVTLLMWGEWEALKQVARFTLMFVAGPLSAGTGLSVLLLYMDWLYDSEEEEDA